MGPIINPSVYEIMYDLVLSIALRCMTLLSAIQKEAQKNASLHFADMAELILDYMTSALTVYIYIYIYIYIIYIYDSIIYSCTSVWCNVEFRNSVIIAIDFPKQLT